MELFDTGGNKFEGKVFTISGKRYFSRECYRCDGTGIYHWSTSYGLASGTCFRCGGEKSSKSDFYRLYNKEELKPVLKRREKYEAKKEAKREAEKIKFEARKAEEEAKEAEKKAKLDSVIKARRDAELKSVHVGTVGVREDFTFTVDHFHWFHSDIYGWNSIAFLTDENGNKLIYKGRADIGLKGETVIVKATVKEHAVREDVKQTIISRPKLIEKKIIST